jgi:HD-GYP domain-containing protein (c-di-GMP phosphodiesterase class II)
VGTRGRRPACWPCTLTKGELDNAPELIADYADLKSPWFTGHSRSVASLATAAARSAGLPESEVVSLPRAALVHDIGRNGVSNSIWDKCGPLTDSEMERVQLHAYYTDRVLRRARKLAELASVASAAHERIAGGGYPRRIAGMTIPLLGRYLEAADVYHAMLEDRPHRPAHSHKAAADELRRAAHAGELDGSAVDAVLTVAGHATRSKPAAPATPRETGPGARGSRRHDSECGSETRHRSQDRGQSPRAYLLQDRSLDTRGSCDVRDAAWPAHRLADAAT